MKPCTKCHRALPLDEFPPAKRMRDGRSSWCRECKRIAQRQRVASEHVRDRRKTHDLRRMYGINRADYDALLKRQDGRCTICKERPSGTGRNNRILCVDHDHNTGAVRGLLCTPCNTAIGALKDSQLLLGRGLLYLAEHDLSTRDVIETSRQGSTLVEAFMRRARGA